MKNKIASFIILAAAALTLASCATSKKYGCPTVSVQKADNKS